MQRAIDYREHYFAAGIGLAVVTVAGGIVLAHFSERWVERPIMSMMKRSRDSKPAIPAQAA